MDIDTYVDKAIQGFKERAGKKGYLEKVEFCNIVRSDLKHFLTDTECDKAVAALMKEVDKNKDGKINFDEYKKLVEGIAIQARTIRANNATPPQKK